jgi:hypothetical protein
MKKSIVLLMACVISSVSYSQVSDREVESLVESAADMFRRMDYRRELGGHEPDTNFVFQNTLLKLFRGTLNVDSLIASQPQLHLIVVNESLTDPVYTQNAMDFFRKPEFVKYNTVDYVFSHRVSEVVDGYHEESISIRKKETANSIRSVIIQYESYSNQLRLIVDNCYEHLK